MIFSNRIKMLFPVPKTLKGAMSPMILASWIFGIGIVEYPTGHPRPKLSVCWSLVHLCLFLSFTSLAIMPNKTQVRASAVGSNNYRIIVTLTVTCVIVYLYLGHTKSKKIVASLNKLDRINEVLDKYDIPTEYGLTFKHQIIQLIVALSNITTMTVLGVVTTNCTGYTNTVRFGYLSAMFYLLTNTYIVDCSFANLIRYIGKRFQIVNNFFGQSCLEGGNVQPFVQSFGLDDSQRPSALEIHANLNSLRIANKQWMIQFIWNIRKVHHELCETANILNEAFGIQILLSITMSFGLITALLYSIYHISVSWTTAYPRYNVNNVLVIIAWLVFHVTKVLYIVHNCTMTSNQAKKMGDLLHEFVKPNTDSKIKEEIHEFSLQLLHDPLHFTAAGFFAFDYRMICSMVSAVTTYLVIMIQLRSIYDTDPKLVEAAPTSHLINTTYEN